MANEMENLQSWYLAQCDGDWEHTYGVEIGTLDNPGWRVEINIEETGLAGRTFERLEVERSEHDWLHCWAGMPDRPNAGEVRAESFEAACGPQNLLEVLGVFLEWARG